MTKKRADEFRKEKRLWQRRRLEKKKGEVNLDEAAPSCAQLKKRRSILAVFFGNKRGRVQL